MIFNFIKHLVVALLLDAGAAFAFGTNGTPAPAPVAQSCALPAALTGTEVPTPVQGAHS